jgi:O-succinylbenzoic acid--CoA ligase
MIEFDTNKTFVLRNPKSKIEEAFLSQLETLYQAHFWLFTSGTSGVFKAVALSKEALLLSAAAVNKRVSVDKKDIWVNPLPLFHVGGLGIEARSALSKSLTIRLSAWDPDQFIRVCEEKKATLTSLVPTQLSDLIKRDLKAPKTLRAVFIGGDFLNDRLFEKGKELGWPLFITYGMTECASQIATSQMNKRELSPLSHISLRIEEGKIFVKSPSLLTAYAFYEKGVLKLSDPKKEGWFETEDFGEFKEGILHVKGRSLDYVKISGEGLYLSSLEEILQSVSYGKEVTLIPLADERRGQKIALVYEEGIEVEPIVLEYNKRVLPVAKIAQLIKVQTIPKTGLGKVKKEELIKRY